MRMKLPIGSTHISEDLVKVNSITELNIYNTLYHLSYNDDDVYLIHNLAGYFEINNSTIQVNDLKKKSKNDLQFIEDFLMKSRPKFVYNLLSFDEVISQNIKIKESLRKYSEMLGEIEKALKRGAKRWYYTLYLKCFFNYSSPEVYLTKDGFVFENVREVFGNTTKRTIRGNLEKLKNLNILTYRYEKNTITELKFNFKKVPLFKGLVPSIFSSAFFDDVLVEQFEPINNKLEKLDIVERFESANRKKTDYVSKQIENELVGRKSEQLAFQFEIKRLVAEGIEDYNEKIKIVSDDSSLGYDILSVENDMEKRYIEVKTIKRNDDLCSFYITDNEIQKMKKLSNYYIYIVIYTKNEHSVKIIDTANMIDSENFKIVPIDYKVYLKYPF